MKLVVQVLLIIMPILGFAHKNDETENDYGTIKGYVTTNDNKPAPSVTVHIKDNNKNTVTNENGSFTISKLAAGNYVIEISLVGYEKLTKSIVVEKNKITNVSLQLQLSQSQLDEVVVTSGKNKFAKKETVYVARMPLENLENAQVYSVIGKELLKEQVSVDAKEALRNAVGAAPVTYPAGGIGITSRGFSTGVNARNGMETVASRSSIDIANVEMVEVIKGPSGTLFGSSISSFGGVVNLVTKKPMETFKGEASYTFGSFGLNRLTADINTPLNKNNSALLRINTAVNKQNSFLNYGHNNTFFIAPSLSYKVNDRFTITADAEYLVVDQSRVMYTRVTTASKFTSPENIPLAYNKTLYLDDANAKTNSSKWYVEGKYKLSDKWTSSTMFSFASENVTQSYQYYPTWISDTSVARNVLIYGPIFNNYTNIQQNFNGDFKTGPIRHRVLAGVNYRYYNGSFNYTTSGTKFIDTVYMNKTYTALGKAKIDQFMLSYGTMTPSAISNQQTISAYATDVINLTKRLSAMLSLRVDRYNYKGVSSTDGYKQTSLAPKLGLVYQLVKDQISVFGNYMSGFQNNAPVNQPNGSLLVLKPLYADQSEIGIKMETWGKKLNMTVSYYNISIDNATRTDANSYTIQDGKQISKGTEVEIIANPIAGLNILAGYAYNDNRIVKATDKTIEGNLASGAPQNMANLWMSYKFQNTLKGIGLGFGGNYVGKAYLATANTYYMPEYTVLNASFFYDQPKWRFDFKVNNLASKKNWDLYGSPQALSNFAGNLTIKF